MSSSEPANRPFGVTALLGLVLMFTVLQILRSWAALANWEFLSSLPLNVPPVYLLATGILWAAVGVWTAFGLAWRKDWAPGWLRAGAAGYALFYWADRLLLQQPGPQSSNLVFAAALSALLLGSIFAVLALPQARAYYGGETPLE